MNTIIQNVQRSSQRSNRSRHEKKCMNREILKPQKSFLCENSWCKKPFPTRFNLIRHQVSCKVKKAAVFTCTYPYCEKPKL